MTLVEQPLVSIVTPVYNGAKYLAECAESVLNQTYRNWDYVIVNNCSTDATLEIAREYARRDRRIRVINNDRFLEVIENHNFAIRQIARDSRYCKVLCADDYLFPEAIEKQVSLAESYLSAPIVGSYAISDYSIRWIGLPPHGSVFDGKKICRLYLLGTVDSFGTESTVLYRSDLVRRNEPFFPGSQPNADMAACLRYLKGADFAFVHQILSYERVHESALSTPRRNFGAFLTDRIQFLDQYGRDYLNEDEIKRRRKELLSQMYKGLAVDVVNLRWGPAWNHQRKHLEAFGRKISICRMIAAAGAKFLDLLFNPKQTIEKILRRRSGKLRSLTRAM